MSEHLQKLKEMPEPTDPEAKIPWCIHGYTVKQSKEKCPLGGCWKYRCRDSMLNAQWHKEKEKWDEERYGRKHR